MIIENVLVYTEEKQFVPQKICIRNGVFADIDTIDCCEAARAGKTREETIEEMIDEKTLDEEVIDGNGCYAIPGLIDIHFHGCADADFCDGTTDAIATIAEYEVAQGITTIVPATMTLPEDHLMKIMRAAADYKNENGAVLAGIHLEGPFISHEKKGAQSAAYIRKPDIVMFHRLQSASNGLIKLCDIAPETEGAMEFIEALKDEVKISFAHTAADYDTAKRGYDMGACHATHLYNGMSAFSHREPGVVGAARDCEQVYVELICDGVHVHPAAVRAAFDMFGDERIVMISDSMRATGLTDGEYTLGDQAVRVTGRLAALVSDGTIAGSCTNLMECMRIAVQEMEIPLERAVACVTMNPAKSVGLYDRYGSITTGKVGNVVLLDKDLSLKAVIIHGEKL